MVATALLIKLNIGESQRWNWTTVTRKKQYFSEYLIVNKIATNYKTAILWSKGVMSSGR